MIYINKTGKQNQVWMPKPYDIVINDCPDADDAYNSGYTSGYTDGLEEGYPSGRTDGFEEGYTSGYTDGLNACSGGSCEGIWEKGYNSGYTDGQASVDCTDFYNSGKTDGIAEQKAKLTSTAFTSNGTYTRADGWNRVTVNVASGYSKDDLDRAFQSGYTAGLRDCSGFTPAADLTLNVASAITGTGQATVTVNPSDAGTDITYTSSDPTVATINNNGGITVHQDGTVTFCAVDNLTQLQDCKTVNVTADSGSGVYLVGMYYVTSTTEPTQILTRNYGHDILLDKMEYPLGHSRETSNYFTFPSTGMQTMYFYFKDPTTIPDKTFSGVTQLVGVNIPSVINKIGDGAFRETSLTEVTVPSGVSLGNYAFTRIPTLTAVTLGENLSFSGGMECFSRTPITSITFPQSISAAPSHVLYNCSALTNVVFNGTLERLGDAAFGNCIALRNYVIPSSVTFIGESCFAGIPNIGSITLLRTTPAPLDDNTTSLGYITETFPIYVPAGSIEAYKAEYLNYAPRIQAIP